MPRTKYENEQEQFAHDVTGEFEIYLINRGILKDCQVVYTGGGYYELDVQLVGETILRVNESGIEIAPKDEPLTYLANIAGAGTPRQLARKVAEIWSLNK